MMAAAIAIGVYTFGAGIWGANKQADIQKAKVRLGYADNLEKIRRRSFTQEQTKGKAKARSENAGVLHRGGSTPQNYMDVITTEFKKELDWMKTYAETAKALGLEAANVERKAAHLDAFSEGINAGMSMYGMG